MAFSRLLLISLLSLLLALPLVAPQQADFTKEAGLKLLRTTLSSPDDESLLSLEDAKSLLSHLFNAEQVEELVASVKEEKGGIEPSCSAAETASTELPDYADRHIQRIEAARKDYDCMEREFDVSAEDYNYKEAAKVLAKCRVLVLKNVFEKDLIQQYRANFSNYISDLHEGLVEREGKTNHGEGGFVVERDQRRWDVLVPEHLASGKMVTNPEILKVLRRKVVLGKDAVVHSLGGIIAEANAPAGKYHYDDNYLFEESSFDQHGVAGHDMAPFAITMMTPLLTSTNMTYDHGPTEFCIGSSHMRGLEASAADDDFPVWDETLLRKDSHFADMLHFINEDDFCPPQFHRVPNAQLGDAVLFDYQITHRGGANISPDLRPMLYVAYSRYWYKDSNFDADILAKDEYDAMSTKDKLTMSTRFALVEERDGCDDAPNCPERTKLESLTNFMKTKKRSAFDVKGLGMREFGMTNVDVEDASIYAGDDNKHLTDLAVGESFVMKLKIGSTLTLYGEEEKVLKVWKVQQKQRQIVISNKLLGLV